MEVLKEGQFVRDTHGKQWVVGRANGKSALLHAAAVELDEHGALVQDAVDTDTAVRFVGHKQVNEANRVHRVWESKDAYIEESRDARRQYQEWKRREREKAQAAEAQDITYGKTFYADGRNTVEVVRRNDDGSYMLHLRWHAPSRCGKDGVWLINAYVGPGSARHAYGGAVERSVDVLAMHSCRDGLGSSFSTYAYAKGDALEAALAAIMQVVAS